MSEDNKKDVFNNEDIKNSLESTKKKRKNRKMIKNTPVENKVVEEVILKDEDSSSSDFVETFDENDLLDYFDLDMDLFVNGKQLIDDSQVKLFKNKKYGLVGKNGAGKTTLLKAIRQRKFGIPKNMKIHMIKQEFGSKKTVLEYVGLDGGRALQLLGFSSLTNEEDCSKSKTPTYNTIINDLSGGWRMRVQLAKAIHKNPELLLLDEPTNFLDIETITFLEEFVKQLKTVIVVSHDRHFLNTVCDSIMHLDDKKITLYRGNYDAFLKQREDIINNQIKLYNEQQLEIAHLMSFINRFRANAARSSQAQSRMKTLEKMVKLELPKVEPKLRFRFLSDRLACQFVIELRDATYSYGEKLIFSHVNLKIESDSRIVIVGENGQGKSTILKLLAGQLKDQCGNEDSKSKFNQSSVIMNPDCKIGYFAQHHIDHLDMSVDAVTYMKSKYPLEEARRRMSNFGLASNQAIASLSGGQKSRLAFANLDCSNLLILDEPTNHLDIVAISALSEAINEYKGAVICVSHDMAFLEECFHEVYICEGGSLSKFDGTPEEYKNVLRERINKKYSS